MLNQNSESFCIPDPALGIRTGPILRLERTTATTLLGWMSGERRLPAVISRPRAAREDDLWPGVSPERHCEADRHRRYDTRRVAWVFHPASPTH